MDDYRTLPRDEKQIFWEKHINTWKQDGMSKKEYCQSHNLNPHTFSYWIGQLKVQKKAETGLVPVSFTPPKLADDTGPALELVLSDSLTLLIPSDFNRQHLIRVLQVLGIQQ